MTIPQDSSCFAKDASLTSVHQALDIMKSICSKPLVQLHNVHINQALGRILAKDIISDIDIPRFNNVALDGYGFASESITKQGQWLTVVSHAKAGSNQIITCPKGQAVRVLTGARLPQGVDTVIMEEDIKKVKQDAQNRCTIQLPDHITPGSHWRKQGEDVKKGQVVLLKGHKISAVDIGLLASLALEQVAVYESLPIAVFSTGSEVKECGAELVSDSVVDVNRPLLKNLLQPLSNNIYDGGIIPDSYDQIQQALLSVSGDYPVILTSGGASLGDEDHLSKLLHEQGEVFFHRVALKPGRPFIFARFNDSLVFGFPGNPVAVVVSYFLLAQPNLFRLAGREPKTYQSFNVPVGFSISNKAHRMEWLRVKLIKDDDGVVRAYKAGPHGSGILTSVVYADGFLQVDEHQQSVHRDDVLPFISWAELTV